MIFRIIHDIDHINRHRKQKKAYEKWAAVQKAQGLPYDERTYKKNLRKRFWSLKPPTKS